MHRLLKRKPVYLFLFSPQTICGRLLSSSATVGHEEYSRLADARIKSLASIPNRPERLIVDRKMIYQPIKRIFRTESNTSAVYALDEVADEYDCTSLCKQLQASEMQSFMVTPGERKLPGDTSVLEYVLNERAILTIDHLKRLMYRVVQHQVNDGRPLQEAGAILSWLSPPYAINTDSYSRSQARRKSPDMAPEAQQTVLSVDEIAPPAGTYSYWSAHCDKANNPDYDVSALLYLNSDFEGGDLLFMDDTGESVIQPKRGRLVVFNSCVDNIHRVRAVTEGNRFLLSVWYSRR